LQKKDFKKLKINIPKDVIEQTRIAEILSTTDQAIEQTEKLIAKYQRIKTGLMQDLLTKGIDEKGNIRNEKTHRFKTEKGLRVPEEWEVDVIDNLETDVLDFKANGSFETLTANVKYYYEQNYARLIRLTDLRNELKYDGVYIDETGFQFLKKTRLVEGDILISCVGEYTGFVCQMPKVPYHSTIAPNMFVIRFKSKIVNAFAYRFMTSSQFQNQILVVSTSSATKLLNNPNLRSLKLVIPSKTEQLEISIKFDTLEKLIIENKTNLEKLYSLKSGLMQDLLYGNVRVKVKEEATI
jgi:type I restriction enzyme, S subunit